MNTAVATGQSASCAQLRKECEQRDMELSCEDYPYEAYAAGADWDGDDEEEEDW